MMIAEEVLEQVQKDLSISERDNELTFSNLVIANGKLVLSTHSVRLINCNMQDVRIEFVSVKWYDKYFKKIKSLFK